MMRTMAKAWEPSIVAINADVPLLVGTALLGNFVDGEIVLSQLKRRDDYCDQPLTSYEVSFVVRLGPTLLKRGEDYEVTGLNTIKIHVWEQYPPSSKLVVMSALLGIDPDISPEELERQALFEEMLAIWEARYNQSIEDTGYNFIGDYEEGLEVTEYSQVVRDSNGEYWRLSGTTDLPYTILGTGLPENGAFIYVGDAVLRQLLELPAFGDSIIAHSSEETVRQRFDRIPTDIGNQIVVHNHDPVAHPEMHVFITSEADRAEAAANSAFVNADVYDSIADGLDSGDEQFQVAEGVELVRYRNESGDAVEVARYPASEFVAGQARSRIADQRVINLVERYGGNVYDLNNAYTYPVFNGIGEVVGDGVSGGIRAMPLAGLSPLLGSDAPTASLINDARLCASQPAGQAGRARLFAESALLPTLPCTLVLTQRTDSESRRTLYWQRDVSEGGEGEIQITANNEVTSSGGTVRRINRVSVYIRGAEDTSTGLTSSSMAAAWRVGQTNTLALVLDDGFRASELWVNGEIVDRFTAPPELLQSQSYLMGHPSPASEPDDVYHGRYVFVNARLDAAELDALCEWSAQGMGSSWVKPLVNDADLTPADSMVIYHLPKSSYAQLSDSIGNLKLLYAKNRNLRITPASVTKIITSLTVERWTDDYDQIVTVQAGDLSGGSGAPLQAGDEITLRDMLYALMVTSSNSAANAIARHVGGIIESELSLGDGDYAAFISEMNVTAERLGLVNTSLQNPSGLRNPANFMSADDVAKSLVAGMSAGITRDTLKAPNWLVNVVGENERQMVAHRFSDAAADWPDELIYFKGGSLTLSDLRLRTYTAAITAPNGDYIVGAAMWTDAPNDVSSARPELIRAMREVAGRVRWPEKLPLNNNRRIVDLFKKQGVSPQVANIFKSAPSVVFDFTDPDLYWSAIGSASPGDAALNVASYNGNQVLYSGENPPRIGVSDNGNLVLENPVSAEQTAVMRSNGALLPALPCTLAFSMFVEASETESRTAFFQSESGAVGRVQIVINGEYTGSVITSRPGNLAVFIAGSSGGGGLDGQPKTAAAPTGRAVAVVLSLSQSPGESELWVNGQLIDKFTSAEIHQTDSYVMGSSSFGSEQVGVQHGRYGFIGRSLNQDEVKRLGRWVAEAFCGNVWDAKALSSTTALPNAVAAVSYELQNQASRLSEYCSENELFLLGHKRILYPASMTKVLTAMVLLDNISDMDSTIEMQSGDETGGSGDNLNPGDILTISDALYNLMLPSSNVTATVVARTVGELLLNGDAGDPVARFVEEMNRKARSLGMLNSNFTNASGLSNSEMVTTAEDMGRLCANVPNYPDLFSRWGATEHDLNILGPNARVQIIGHSAGAILNERNDFQGGKTGTVGSSPQGSVSRNFMWIGRAPNGSYTANVVMLTSSHDRYNDAEALQDYIFRNFRWPLNSLH